MAVYIHSANPLTSKHLYSYIEMWLPFKVHFFLVGIDSGWHSCHCQLCSEHNSIAPLTQFVTNLNLTPGNLPFFISSVKEAYHLGNECITYLPSHRGSLILRLFTLPFNVGKLIVSSYIAVSITNWLQDVSATKAFVSCVKTDLLCM